MQEVVQEEVVRVMKLSETAYEVLNIDPACQPMVFRLSCVEKLKKTDGLQIPQHLSRVSRVYLTEDQAEIMREKWIELANAALKYQACLKSRGGRKGRDGRKGSRKELLKAALVSTTDLKLLVEETFSKLKKGSVEYRLACRIFAHNCDVIGIHSINIRPIALGKISVDELANLTIN